ncbi:choice-of-anchor G family protein [Curtobacterium sp. 458]|uniref:choice-of-anchor G family protein n=1 Tax=Curtobacterium sp. 458 TaxID=3050069 RepID=UPI0025B43E09|nr:choice-of-anchor G family protein [Curtobacterium sp. 458]WJY01482.1 choice-of-anchor G family protein [Curtobacterium sp. 458]
MPSTATRFALRAGATATVAAVIIGGAALPANAAATDVTQAEGRLLAGSGTVDLDTIAALAGSYGATAPGGAADGGSNPLDLTVLDSLGVQVPGGIQLLGANGLVDVGVAGQYSSTSTTGAVAAAGAVTGDGAIQVGAPGSDGASIDLQPLLAGLDLDGVISDASVDLGALSARAEATRTFEGADVSTDYQVASADVSVVSPAVAALVGQLNTTLGTTSTTLNTALGAGGVTTALTGAVTDDLTDVLNTVPGIAVGDTTATVTADVDLAAAVSSITASPLTSGAVTIDLSTGTVSIDLDDLYTLNDLAPNTRLLASDTINAQIEEAIADILTNQVPALLTDALQDALDVATVNVDVSTDATVLVADAGLDISVDTTLGQLLGTSTTDPEVTLTGTGALALLDDLGLTAGLEAVVDTALLPALTTAVGGIVTEDFVSDTVDTLVDTLEDVVTALDPVLDALNELVSITINSQTAPAFSDPDGDATGATTVRAVRIELLPAVDAATVDIATATVQADAFAGIAITDPEDGTETTVPTEDDTTDVPVSGTAEPGSDVDVTLDGDEDGTQSTVTDEDGTWTVTFPDVAVGDHEAVAVETIGTLVSDPDSVTFVVAAAPVDPTDPTDPTEPGTPGTPGGPGGDGPGAGVGPGAGGGGGSLAYTGAELLPIMLIAGLLLAAGGGTLLARRLRRTA